MTPKQYTTLCQLGSGPKWTAHDPHGRKIVGASASRFIQAGYAEYALPMQPLSDRRTTAHLVRITPAGDSFLIKNTVCTTCGKVVRTGVPHIAKRAGQECVA